MTRIELAEALKALSLTQANLARLLSVTTRAVSFWLAEEGEGGRAIPGPVEAYVRLLRSLPPHLRQAELSRLSAGGRAMREGMYSLDFRSRSGAGTGMLVVEGGRAYGGDLSGARYDGGYVEDGASGRADLRLRLTFPAHVESAFGVTHPHEWSVEIGAAIETGGASGITRAVTDLGHEVDVAYRYLRPMPDA